MPAPLAKGIMLTVSVLVAAGVAVYQSPQFQEWMNTSRRKVAVALHNLGDEINPRNSSSPSREDISMNEEIGEAAEERRRIARAEIMRRAAFLESRRFSKSSEQPGSFDTLVDDEGNLRMHNRQQDFSDDNNGAISTGVDTGASQQLRRGKLNHADANQLHLDISSDTASHHPSESIIQYTPTSEHPHGDMYFDPFSDSPVRGQSPVTASTSASSHTEENESVYYTHPRSVSISSQHPDLLADLQDFNQWNQTQHQVSSAPSIAGSSTHEHPFDLSSDGTLSDLGAASVGGVATPASWSDIGSVVSDSDAGHHQLL